MSAADDAVAAALAALRAADDTKGVDPALLEVVEVLGLVDLFAIVTGTSERHVKALADAVEQTLKHDHDRPTLRREGEAASGWVLLDYGDVVVHVFSRSARETYDLERLWTDVPRRDPVSGEITDPGSLPEPEDREHLLVDESA